MVRNGAGRRRSNSMESVDSFDDRRRRGGGGGVGGRGQPAAAAVGNMANQAKGGYRPESAYMHQAAGNSNSSMNAGSSGRRNAPSLVTPTNRGGAYYPNGTPPPAVVAQAAPFGAHQFMTYPTHPQQQPQPQPQHYQPPVAAPLHAMYSQQPMMAMHQQQQHLGAKAPMATAAAAHHQQHQGMHQQQQHYAPVGVVPSVPHPMVPPPGLLDSRPAPAAVAAHHHQYPLSVEHHHHHLPVAAAAAAGGVVPPLAAGGGSAVTLSNGVPAEINGEDAAELYRTLCSHNDEVLPAGWEKIVFNGQIIYLDHLNREAHDEHPFKIWSRAFGAQQQQ